MGLQPLRRRAALSRLAMVSIVGLISGFMLVTTVSAPAQAAGVSVPAAGYHAIAPKRVLDTRVGTGARKGTIAAGRTIRLSLPSSVPSDASSVVLNVTVMSATKAGYVSVYEYGQANPDTPLVSFPAGTTVSNLAVVAPSQGALTIYNHTGSVQVVADLEGWYTARGYFNSAHPEQVLDTRSGEGTRKGTVGAGKTVTGGLTGVVQIAASAGDTLALTRDHVVYSWGENGVANILGISTGATATRLGPGLADQVPRVTRIATAESAAFAVGLP